MKITRTFLGGDDEGVNYFLIFASRLRSLKLTTAKAREDFFCEGMSDYQIIECIAVS